MRTYSITNLKKIILLSVLFSNVNAFAATVTPSLAGTIAIKGNVYTSGCQTHAGGTNYYLAIPVTFASDYKKGDMSPLSPGKSIVIWKCPFATKIKVRVDGNADTTDPTLFKITQGSGKATGVALRVIAEDGNNQGTFFQMVPNTSQQQR